jgi:hypothetical protein
MKTFLIALLMSISFAVCAQSEDEHYNHYIAHTVIIETGGEEVKTEYVDGNMVIYTELPEYLSFTLYRMVLHQMIEYNYKNVEIYLPWIYFEEDNKYQTIWKHGENNYVLITFFKEKKIARYTFGYKRE